MGEAQISERRASWLELFYDLVFVISISKVASILAHDVSWRGLLAFTGMFFVVGWPWTVYTAYSSRFNLDDGYHRLATLAQMLASAATAVTLANVPGALDGRFAMAYCAVRVCLLALYLRGAMRFDKGRDVMRLLFGGYSLVSLVWLASIFVPSPVRYVMWGAALAADLATPLIFRSRLRLFPADTAHLPERFGLFTLIVLGESIYAVVSGLGVSQWVPEADVAAGMGFLLAAALWWSYFNYVERAPLQCSLGDGQLYMYLHMPAVFGLTMASVGVGLAIPAAGSDALPPATVWLLTGGTALWLGCFLAIQSTTYPPAVGRRLWRSYVPMFGLLAGLTIAGSLLPPLLMLGLLLVGMGALAAFDVHWRVAVPARSYQAADDPRDAPIRKLYRGEEVDVSFEPALCTHSGECLRRLPDVFDLRSRPWVRPDLADPVAVLETVRRCPSGALKIARGPDVEIVAPTGEREALVTLVPDGPLLVASGGGVSIEGHEVATAPILSICRCGRSSQFPLCDGSHQQPLAETPGS